MKVKYSDDNETTRTAGIFDNDAEHKESYSTPTANCCVI